MSTPLRDNEVRAAMFAFLERLTAQHPEGIPSAELNMFRVGSQPLKLVVQPGIWKPAALEGALTIRTTYTAPNQPPPYADDMAAGGSVKYVYRGTNPKHSNIRARRTAMHGQLPLAYLVGVAPVVYQAHFPGAHRRPAARRGAAHGDWGTSLHNRPIRAMWIRVRSVCQGHEVGRRHG